MSFRCKKKIVQWLCHQKNYFATTHTPHSSTQKYFIINQFSVSHLPLFCGEIFIHQSYCLFPFGSIMQVYNMHLPSLWANHLLLLESTNECKGIIYNRARMPSFWNFTCWKTFLSSVSWTKHNSLPCDFFF